MKIAVIGSGYVGTTMAACFADLGHDVSAVDIDEAVVDRLNAGEISIHEPGLDELVAEHAGDRLVATTDYGAIVDADLVFVAVQTPSRKDGSIDVSAVRAATRSAVDTLVERSANPDGHVLVIKSTVTPPQLADLQEIVVESTEASDVRIEFATNPEFLREGSAINDFRQPDKIVFGAESDWATERLTDAYAGVIRETDPAVITTDPRTASMIKYANNAFLAAKISLINDIGNICKEFDIDAYEVADAIATDDRIGDRFLRSGVGWGGSCFPKDVAAIIAASRAADYDPALLGAAVTVNEIQPDRMLALLERHVDPDGRRIAVLGLSFKPGTDDIRNSRAIPIIEGLLTRGASVVAFDPIATEIMRERFPDIEYAKSAASALADAHGALVVTDWDEFTDLDEAFTRMETPVVIDGRRIVEPPSGVTYEGLTW